MDESTVVIIIIILLIIYLMHKSKAKNKAKKEAARAAKNKRSAARIDKTNRDLQRSKDELQSAVDRNKQVYRNMIQSNINRLEGQISSKRAECNRLRRAGLPIEADILEKDIKALESNLSAAKRDLSRV